jgi:hypothetical protein
MDIGENKFLLAKIEIYWRISDFIGESAQLIGELEISRCFFQLTN